MKTFAALAAVALLTLAAGPALAGPCGDSGGAADMTGSRWVGTTRWDNGEVNQVTATFRADCTVVYSYRGATYDNGRWMQSGRMVQWDTNDNYAIYVGRLDGGVVGGANYNRVGAQGSWSFRRVRR